MKRIFLVMLIAMSAYSSQSFAQGNLMITPIRVVFEGNKQKEELTLANIGKDTTTYSISFVQKQMNENGSFVNIEKADSGQMFADPYLRIFPRQVTLAPGEAQVVALQYRRKPGMEAGEYRSHLYFRSEKSYEALGMGDSNQDSTTLSVQLIPIFGMSIPIIIRTGEVSVSAALSNLELDTQPNMTQNLKLTILRTGNISLYGDIKIQYIPERGKSYVIGTAAGVGVYTNINKRYVVVKLNNTSGKTLENGKLKVQYVSKGGNKKPVVYAEGELDIK